ncbi:hypothetical protein [Clostridium sp. D53t1_180928_C8]|nr:hypothetical protein [Clostridium sp. D53t1_180928_C8]
MKRIICVGVIRARNIIINGRDELDLEQDIAFIKDIKLGTNSTLNR